jgi:predicted RNA-binding Zn ribbon-like protein
MDELQMLELLNSAPTEDGRVRELLVDDERTRELVAGLGGDLTDSTLRTLRGVRDDLHRVVRGEAQEEILQRHLDGVVARPVIEDGVLVWRPDLSGADEIASGVVLAWTDLAARFPGRVRACANGECSKFLIDHSRPNSARWCSMADCGNRLKARRHSARRSATEQAAG